jgi:hypothetical protein
MRLFLDFLLIFLLALVQVSFFPLNFLLGYLVFIFLKKDFNYILPRLIFSCLILAILSASSIGLLLLVFTLVFGLIGWLKTRLPPALFIRASFIALSIPIAEVLYQQLFLFWGRL